MTHVLRGAIVVGLAAAATLGFAEQARSEPRPAARSPRQSVAPVSFRTTLCRLPPHRETLPPGSLRGLAWHLEQYPTVALASSRERRAARRLLARIERVGRRWRSPRGAAADGYDTDLRRAAARDGSRAVTYLHAERRRTSRDAKGFDPLRPKAVIYANTPGQPLRLVGVMYAMQRGRTGPSPGGPITRWHWHDVCVKGVKRGLALGADGTCPPETTRRQGSEMMHVWFTGDLRSAFAIHAPEPDLCRVGLVAGTDC